MRLPSGAKIVSATLLYSTSGSPAPLYQGEVWSMRGGGNFRQLIGCGGSNVTGGSVSRCTSREPISDAKDLVVDPGLGYQVEVYSHNRSTRIHGLEVAFTAP